MYLSVIIYPYSWEVIILAVVMCWPTCLKTWPCSCWRRVHLWRTQNRRLKTSTTNGEVIFRWPIFGCFMVSAWILYTKFNLKMLSTVWTHQSRVASFRISFSSLLKPFQSCALELNWVWNIKFFYKVTFAFCIMAERQSFSFTYTYPWKRATWGSMEIRWPALGIR